MFEIYDLSWYLWTCLYIFKEKFSIIIIIVQIKNIATRAILLHYCHGQ